MKNSTSQKTKQEILQLKKQLQIEKNLTIQKSLQNLLNENQIKLEYQERQEKVQQKKQIQKAKINENNEFSSGQINWKKKSNSLLYNVWEGYYNEKHLFNITQKQQYFELKLVSKNVNSTNMNDIQKKAELFLESFQNFKVPKSKS